MLILLHLLVNVDLLSNCHGNVKLTTSLQGKHAMIFISNLHVCTEITGTDHQPMLLGLPSTTLSTHQF